MTDIDIDDEGPLEPRNNPELLGHTQTEKTLIDAYEGGRLAHAWLICGPKGIGKATLAYRFARFLLVNGAADDDRGLFASESKETASDLYIAPEHPVFRRVSSSGHADLMSVERTPNDKGKLRGEIVVGDVREIGPFMSLTAAEGGWRVVIIDSADEMNRNAANAVLKILEEPPSKAILLLVSHNPGQLLPTIRSRCRQIMMDVPPEDIAIDMVKRYHPQFSDDDARMVVKLSEGSIGRSLAMAEEGGLTLYRDLINLLKTVPNIDIAALHKFADQIGKAGADDAYKTSMELFRGWLHKLIVTIAEGPKQLGDGSIDEDISLINKLSSTGGLDQWLEVWEKMNHLLTKADSVNLERKQVILNIFLSLNETARS